jgi:hypothetical protein
MSDGPHDASTPGQIKRLLRAAAGGDVEADALLPQP